MKFKFIKATGLGNDFVVFQQGDDEQIIANAKHISDRRFGIGCDQIILMNAEMTRLRFINADGSEAESCGNGSRCAAKIIADRTHEKNFTLQTLGGDITCMIFADENVCVSMPTPKFLGDIPIDMKNPFEKQPQGVEVGNPHLICFTDDDHDIDRYGATLEMTSYFKNRTNVGFAQLVDQNHLDLKVWERGTGPTLACGSGACAAVVAAQKCGMVDDGDVFVKQPGGTLKINYNRIQNIITQHGRAEIVFEGYINL